SYFHAGTVVTDVPGRFEARGPGALSPSCDRVTLAGGVPGGGGYNPGLPRPTRAIRAQASAAAPCPAPPHCTQPPSPLALPPPGLPKATDTRGGEVTEAPSRREQVRAQAVAAIPWWYSPWGHLAFPSFVGLGLIAVSIALLEHPTPLELLILPLVLVLVNLNEWHVHRNILHQRTWPLEILFWRHTPEHH